MVDNKSWSFSDYLLFEYSFFELSWGLYSWRYIGYTCYTAVDDDSLVYMVELMLLGSSNSFKITQFKDNPLDISSSLPYSNHLVQTKTNPAQERS